MVDLTDIAALHEEADPGPGLLADQVVVYGSGSQERWNRGQGRAGPAVADDYQGDAVPDSCRGFGPEPVQGVGQAFAAAAHLVEAVEHPRREAVGTARPIDSDQGGHLVLG